jgi:RNA methyltransferase, TrmH family
VEGALDRGAQLDTLYLGPGADRAFASLVARAVEAGARVQELRDQVVEKVATTRTPQPVLAVATRPRQTVAAIAAVGHTVMTIDVADPGNLGTIVRSAEASGADGVVVTGANSVDPHHPKVVRSSAGAIFGIDVAEHEDAGGALAELARPGRRTLGAHATDGDAYDRADLASPCALVLGNEARGLPDALGRRLDGVVCIPMSGGAESLNVAMAAAVLCFEAARQRRAARGR